MIFEELVKKHTFPEVKKVLLKIYPDQKKNINRYEKVFAKLQQLKPKKYDLELYLSLVKKSKKWMIDKSYVNVSGLDKKKKDLLYAIEFTPWNKWLGMKIEKNTLKKYSELEIISYALYEMAFVGWKENKIQGKIKKLRGMVREIKSGKAKFEKADI